MTTIDRVAGTDEVVYLVESTTQAHGGRGQFEPITKAVFALGPPGMNAKVPK